MPPRPALVLIPGLLCDALLWRAQIERFSADHAVRVADHTRSSSMADVARDVLGQIGEERFSLAGLSMGGYVALEMWRQAPHRIERLALLDTSARPDRPELTRRRVGLIDLARRGRFIGVGPLLLPQLIHPDRLGDREIVERIRTMTTNVGRDAFIRQEEAIMSRADSRPLLASITCPTLVLCGREDVLTPLPLHVEMADAIPDAQLVVIERCGHLSTLERPDDVNHALAAWLART